MKHISYHIKNTKLLAVFLPVYLPVLFRRVATTPGRDKRSWK